MSKKQPPNNEPNEAEPWNDVYRHCPHCQGKTKHQPGEAPPEVCAHFGKGLLITVQPDPEDHPWETRQGAHTGTGKEFSIWPVGADGDGEQLVAAWIKTKDNANLFCAARELLKELEHLVRLLEPMERDGSLQVPGLATLNGARRAIKKAKGQTP